MGERDLLFMHEKFSREEIETSLLETLSREIPILREILSSIVEEKKAISNSHSEMMEFIIEKRLLLMESFEPSQLALLETISYLSPALQKEHLTHEAAVQLVQDLISQDNIELQLICDQILTLLLAIFRENQTIDHLLVNAMSTPPLMKEQICHKQCKKIMIGLLEPEHGE